MSGLISLKTLEIFSNVAANYKLGQEEFTGILKVVSDYAHALDLLDDYDYQKVKIKETTSETKFIITHTKALKVIKELKQKFGASTLFGKEKDASFKSSITTIYQTFGGKELYPSVEEKAAHLLYFVIKNHSFVDGNKRTAYGLLLNYVSLNKWSIEEKQATELIKSLVLKKEKTAESTLKSSKTPQNKSFCP